MAIGGKAGEQWQDFRAGRVVLPQRYGQRLRPEIFLSIVLLPEVLGLDAVHTHAQTQNNMYLNELAPE
ncbi:MAG: hypothetical protein ACYCTW_09110, partial [Sulfuricella sp.]